MRIITFTQAGYNDLKIQLDTTISKRPLAVESLRRGREMGDLSENGLYKAAKMELVDIDRQIRFLKNLIKYGRPTIPTNTDTVQFGHKVTVECEKGKKEFTIVGEYEANPKENKISNKSPIGFSLMGKMVGDKIKINTPNGHLIYLIRDISL